MKREVRRRLGSWLGAGAVIVFVAWGTTGCGGTRPSAEPLPVAATAAETTSPSPTPTPTTVVTEQAVTSEVPFSPVRVDDANLPMGETRVTTAGVAGEKVAVFRVTTVDGRETERVLVRESVTREPVSEVTSVGTYVAPPPPAPVQQQAASDGCDPNYADACVPIASDVDCAGGKGDGPAYFDGVARVVGKDIYRLDGDKDGLACNG